MTHRYHSALIVLHWLLAVLIIAALGAGLFLEDWPNSDPAKIDTLRIHMIVGLLIGVLMIVRLVVRLRTKKPPHADTGRAWLNALGIAAHWALYLLVILMVITGVGISAGAGLPDIVFAGRGALPDSFDHLPARAGHGLFASVLMFLILLHLIAAVYHQWVLKDGLLSRMRLKR
ncbi:cytochrome b [Reinekea blandensis]|uniref:Cytochrome B561 n=1 Tax=Reinekea blandensis MED297 TaxID=314283 RepID=A4BKA2_9GAMM|nr:cytochrome b/b6 domain-containing protein [Reinekea blandensis]EAR07469.1 cytochrome B561 [Reinekea sp. MED297] [Reinekea blandensis MED297]